LQVNVAADEGVLREEDALVQSIVDLGRHGSAASGRQLVADLVASRTGIVAGAARGGGNLSRRCASHGSAARANGDGLNVGRTGAGAARVPGLDDLRAGRRSSNQKGRNDQLQHCLERKIAAGLHTLVWIGRLSFTGENTE